MTKEEFEALIDRYLSGDASESEEQLINDFFAAHERKEPQQNRVLSEAMWSSIENKVGVGHTAADENAAHADKQRSPIRRVWLVACLVVLFVTSGTYAYLTNFFSTETHTAPWVTLDTPYGQKSIVTLTDGTRIFMNGGTSISYPEVFKAEKREVKLSGEAFFEVAPNPNQPFIVTTGDVTTEVLGTSFNIQAFPKKQISVTVATGKVQVQMGSQAPGAGRVPGKRRVILSPNDQAIYRPGQWGLTVTEVDLEPYLAWKDNTLFFEDTSLEEVARLLERWYNVGIEFDNDLIKGCRINGTYKDQSLESVLQSIQYMYHIDFALTLPNKVRLSGKGCSAKRLNSS